MSVLAALSCLQGRRADDAADAVLRAGADGVQLTPGCAPAGDLAGRLSSEGVAVRTHHGYHPEALRRRVWDRAGALLWAADSIHPPRADAEETFFDIVEAGGLDGVCVEVMYGPYALGSSASIARAMSLGVELAVDVSHLYIQRCQGTLDRATLDRLLAYEHIGEVHVSANDGTRDSHQRLDASSWGLGWAGERAADGVDIVVESYWHKLDELGRRRQIELIKERIR